MTICAIFDGRTQKECTRGVACKCSTEILRIEKGDEMTYDQYKVIEFYGFYPYSTDDGTIYAGRVSGDDYPFNKDSSVEEIAKFLKASPDHAINT